MIKALEQAIEKIKGLSKERQEYAAEVLEHIAQADDEVYHLTDEERRLVDESLARARPRRGGVRGRCSGSLRQIPGMRVIYAPRALRDVDEILACSET